MTAPPVRPRFELRLDQSPEEVMQRLRDRIEDCPRCTGESVGNHAELFVPEVERRVWSPWLSITADAGEAGGTLLRCRFGPHPAVWTLYMLIAFGLGFALLVATTWGYAQWTMEIRPWAWYAVPAIALLSLALYGLSLLGQRLGGDQMVSLRSALEGLIGHLPVRGSGVPARGRSTPSAGTH